MRVLFLTGLILVGLSLTLFGASNEDLTRITQKYEVGKGDTYAQDAAYEAARGGGLALPVVKVRYGGGLVGTRSRISYWRP